MLNYDEIEDEFGESATALFDRFADPDDFVERDKLAALLSFHSADAEELNQDVEADKLGRFEMVAVLRWLGY
jgi:hypothetical protein